MAIDLAHKLTQDIEDLAVRDIVMITPYRANRDRLKEALTNKSLTDISVTTTDSFQGSEGHVVIAVLCVTEATGTRIVSDSHRICVSLTRQKTGLFLVGDIETVPKGQRDDKSLKRSQSQRDDDGVPTFTRNWHFGKMLDYFDTEKRVTTADTSSYIPATEAVDVPNSWSNSDNCEDSSARGANHETQSYDDVDDEENYWSRYERMGI